MPFLRFTRDKRGYESTFLMHTVRRRGKARQRILYCFRTPPDVKVGRSALDEDAIRSIEENNPEVSFDWTKILEVQPPPAPPSEHVEPRRGRRAKGERPGTPNAQPSEAQPSVTRQRERRPPERTEPSNHPQAGADEKAIVQAAEEIAGEIEEPLEIAEPAAVREELRSPLDVAVGREQAARVRARFAELQARITERGGEAARIDALRLQAEPLNPDTWVTAEDARKGLAEFETRFQEFRRLLGLRKRRRSRRGGVRRRRGRTGGDAQTPGAVAQGGPSTGDRTAGDSGPVGDRDLD